MSYKKEFKIAVIPNALTTKMCNQLVKKHTKSLTPAMFWSDGVRTLNRDVRDCFNYKFRNEILTAQTQKIISENFDLNIHSQKIEDQELVCYPPGNGSERHFDGDHRSYSIVYFLNSEYEGGELTFDTGESFHGLTLGTAVAWENSQDSFHSCQPILKGFKWIVVNWVLK